MKDFMNELGFKYIPQEGVDAWSKIYKGFVLFILIAPNGRMLGSICIKKLEISLPIIIDKNWIIEFNNLNI